LPSLAPQHRSAWRAGWSDLVFFPSRLIVSFCEHVETHFTRLDMPHEVAIPTILRGLQAARRGEVALAHCLGGCCEPVPWQEARVAMCSHKVDLRLNATPTAEVVRRNDPFHVKYVLQKHFGVDSVQREEERQALVGLLALLVAAATASTDFTDTFDLLETEADAVCAIKACPNICHIRNVIGEENDLENDMESEIEFGILKKAVKSAVKYVQQKICKPDPSCLAANAKCQKTLAALKAQAAQLAKEVAALANKAKAAGASSSTKAALAKKLAALAAAAKKDAAADEASLAAALKQVGVATAQAKQDAADAAKAKAAQAEAASKYNAVLAEHKKSKQAALDAAAKASGAHSAAAKAADAYRAAVKAHKDKASAHQSVINKLGM